MTVPRPNPAGARGWTQRRIAVCAVGAALAPVVLFVVLHAYALRRQPAPPAALDAVATPAPAAGSLLKDESGPTSAPAPSFLLGSADAGPSLTGPIAPEEDAATAPADAGSPARTEIDGVGWRRVLRQAVGTGNWKKGAAAIHALSEIDPAALQERDLVASAAAVALAIQSNPAEADRVFDRLGATSAGLDVLYRLMSQRGGTKAAERAKELLGREEVREKASPALRIALDLREAPCSERVELLDRAVADGDERTLVILLALRSPACDPSVEGCCLRGNERMESAVRELSGKTRPQGRRAGPSDPY